LGVQDLLDTPNAKDPAQSDAFHLFMLVGNFDAFSRCLIARPSLPRHNKKEYDLRVKKQAEKYCVTAPTSTTAATAD
jgi:ubiquitin-protein ligase